MPITKENLQKLYPSHLLLPSQYTGLPFDSKPQVEYLRSISAKRIQGNRIGETPMSYLEELDRIIKDVLCVDDTVKHLLDNNPF